MPGLLSLLQCGRDEPCIMDSSVVQHDLWRKESVGPQWWWRWRTSTTYIAEPVSEGRDASEDGGLLHFIAGPGRDKTGHPVNKPSTVLSQTVQRTARVSLQAGKGAQAKD